MWLRERPIICQANSTLAVCPLQQEFGSSDPSGLQVVYGDDLLYRSSEPKFHNRALAGAAHGNTVAIRGVMVLSTSKRTLTAESESPLNAKWGLGTATKPA